MHFSGEIHDDAVIGVAINAVGILIGGIAGLTRKQALSADNEKFLRLVMALGTIVIGLQLTWKNINGSFGSVLKQLFIVLLSMSLGKLCGRLLRLQKMSNAAGRYATERMSKPSTNRFNDGFLVATLLACANPLGVYAAVHEGMTAFSAAFVVKALMDGLAAMSFVAIFGWGVLLSAIPVLAFQGSIFFLVRLNEGFLREHGLAESILATDGLLIFCVALIILNLKKIELTDYLPSLAIAPLITWFWR